ncbi:hypothetical protein E2C01_023415 [Portunus trituberculatus]|uniref:Uncharacterized protein n=1 Tax=Portunus trituberculatus TaxID=210409 RepID=A0A5B7E9X7_PORTR|nr:hypothetical protein [Portunus trituberculatus]
MHATTTDRKSRRKKKMEVRGEKGRVKDDAMSPQQSNTTTHTQLNGITVIVTIILKGSWMHMKQQARPQSHRRQEQTNGPANLPRGASSCLGEG